MGSSSRAAGALLLFMGAFLHPTPARAYGPMTHVGEALDALERMRGGEVATLADLADLVDADPAAQLLLLLGAILPDLREASDAIRFPTHDRAFAAHLLSTVAMDPARDPGERALALGLAAHVCSDIAAQVYAVPRLVATGQVGAPDVMPGLMDDRPDGEAELLVEAILDIYYGDVERLLGLYDHFQPDPPDPTRLDDALTLWLDEATLFFGAAATGDPTAIREEIHGTLGRVADQLTGERRDQILGALDLAQEFNLGDVLILVDGVGLLDELVSAGYEASLDYGEIYRLQAVSPFFGDADHFRRYPDDLADLGPRILLDAAGGHPWLTHWPTWRAEPLAAATVESLAGVPGSPQREGEGAGPPPAALGKVGVYDLWWEDPETGARVTAVSTTTDSATALDRVELVAQLYPLTVGDTPGPVRLQVRKALGGAPYLAGPVVAVQTFVPDAGAAARRGAPPWELRLDVELAGEVLLHAEGLHAELVPAPAEPDTAPGFTTAWEPWYPASLPAWRLERPVYATQLGTYDRFAQSLRVDPFTADLTPPEAPTVDATPATLTPAAPRLQITVRAADPGSGVVAYVVRIGRLEGAGDVLDATTVPALGPERTGRLHWEAPAARLAEGGALWISAHAVNGAGLEGPETGAGPVTLDAAETPREGSGCGCQGASGPGAPVSPLGLLALLLPLLASRRRPRRRQALPGPERATRPDRHR